MTLSKLETSLIDKPVMATVESRIQLLLMPFWSLIFTNGTKFVLTSYSRWQNFGKRWQLGFFPKYRERFYLLEKEKEEHWFRLLIKKLFNLRWRLIRVLTIATNNCNWTIHTNEHNKNLPIKMGLLYSQSLFIQPTYCHLLSRCCHLFLSFQLTNHYLLLSSK